MNCRTVGGLLAESQRILACHAIESPAEESAWLLSGLLHVDRVDLYLKRQAVVSLATLRHLDALLTRRIQREPLQYLVGAMPFRDHELSIERGVFIPRPETELVVEYVLEKTKQSPPKSILDIGTGSGAIAVALALELPTSHVWAVDISRIALHNARQNIKRHKLEQRITLLEGDFRTIVLPGADSFEVMVSNPPYIKTADIEILPPEVKCHEPHLALDGGADGLRYYQDIIVWSRTHLQTQGWLVLELGVGLAIPVQQLITQSCLFSLCEIKKDYNNLDRVLLAHKR